MYTFLSRLPFELDLSQAFHPVEPFVLCHPVVHAHFVPNEFLRLDNQQLDTLNVMFHPLQQLLLVLILCRVDLVDKNMK